MSNKKAMPSGLQIKNNPTPFEYCNTTFLAIKNKSNGVIQYNFGGSKLELDTNEEDIYPSPNAPMSGKIEFSIPTTTTSINIKIKTVQQHE